MLKPTRVVYGCLLLVACLTGVGCADTGLVVDRTVPFHEPVDEAALERGIRLTPGVELTRIERHEDKADRYLFEAQAFDFFGLAEHASGSADVRFRVRRYHGRPTPTHVQAANTMLDRMVERIEQAMADRRKAAR